MKRCALKIKLHERSDLSWHDTIVDDKIDKTAIENELPGVKFNCSFTFQDSDKFWYDFWKEKEKGLNVL